MSTIDPVRARYDGLADWYDQVMRDPGHRGSLAASAYDALADLLGEGTGTVLDIGCGTGLASERIRRLGYRPFGVDISFDQVQVAGGRLAAAQGDAALLPIASGRASLACSTFVSSDLDDFGAAVREAFRVLRPGGRYITVGLHPCLNGGYSDLQPDGSVVVRPGYEVTGYQPESEFQTTIRSHVGAWHRPLAETVNTFLESGFRLIRLTEIGPAALPSLLGITVEKP